jgi:UDP-N-acetyl-D-galactosamine dehydrogenase
VDVCDPHASSEEMIHEYGFGLTEINGTDYDAVILAVSHEQFRKMDEEYLMSITKPHAVIYDLKGLFRNKIKNRVYWSLICLYWDLLPNLWF